MLTDLFFVEEKRLINHEWTINPEALGLMRMNQIRVYSCPLRRSEVKARALVVSNSYPCYPCSPWLKNCRPVA